MLTSLCDLKIKVFFSEVHRKSETKYNLLHNNVKTWDMGFSLFKLAFIFSLFEEHCFYFFLF
jgi:hypothetical protein